MAQTLNWMDVLNEQAEWTSPEALYKWLDKVLPPAKDIPAAALAEFQDDLQYMRRQLAALHFGQSIDPAYINRSLSQFTAQLFMPGDSDNLPLLRPPLKDQSPASRLTCLRQSLLLQFATFLSQCLQGQIAMARCQGLYKERYLPQSPAARLFDSELEHSWRQEISHLQAVPDNELQRCADVFIARPKARFCSEACRFRTFQLLKQAEDPGYLAAKQRRYRGKQQG